MGKTQTIQITPGSFAHQAYQDEQVTEQFTCNFGLNPRFRGKIENSSFPITGNDLNGEVRIVEKTDHPFYMATLFQPQLSSTPEHPHPIVTAYLHAARDFQKTVPGKEI